MEMKMTREEFTEMVTNIVAGCLERLRPAGTESSVLLAEERSGSDSKRPLTDASGSPLPDQAEAWIREAAPFLEHAVCIVIESAPERLGELEGVQSVLEQCPYDFTETAAAQSEVEAAQPDNCKREYAGVWCELAQKHMGRHCLQCPAKRAKRSESGNAANPPARNHRKEQV